MNTTTPSKLSIIFAGEDLTAVLLDGSTALVRVRAMPARHLGRVAYLADKESDLLEFVCFIPREGGGFDPVEAGWADNLNDDTHGKLYEAAKRLNFSRAAIWAERQIAAKQFTGELALKAEEVMIPLVGRMVELLGLSPKSSSIPATPSTKS